MGNSESGAANNGNVATNGSNNGNGNGNGSNNGNGQSTSGPREEPILLNVYEPAPQNGQQQMSMPGFGVFHTGLEIYGTEYSFAGGDSTSSGIQPQQPRYMPAGAPWIYKKTEKVGTTLLTRTQIQTLIAKMGSEYPNNTYNLIARNCNHFSDDLCKRISKGKNGIPSWVNRSASMANAFFGAGGMPGQPASAPAPVVPPPEPSVFTKPGYSLSSGTIVDPAKKAKQTKSASNGAPAKRKNPWADPTFKPSGRALKDNDIDASVSTTTPSTSTITA